LSIAEDGWSGVGGDKDGGSVTIVCVFACVVLEVTGGGCGSIDGSGVKVISGFMVDAITVVGANSGVESGSEVCYGSAPGSGSTVKTATSLQSLLAPELIALTVQ
jgi:hypothetical protein